MELLKEILPQFGLIFVFFTIGIWLTLAIVQNVGVQRWPPLVDPKHFKELSHLTKDEKRKILGQVNREAHSGRLSILPPLIQAATIALAVASGLTAANMTNMLHSLWVAPVIGGAIGGVLGWTICKLNARHLRPFLIKYLETTGPSPASPGSM